MTSRFKSFLSKPYGLAVVILLSMVIGACVAINLIGKDTALAVDNTTTANQQKAILNEMQQGFISIVDEVLPSVVSITSIKVVSVRDIVPWFDEEFFQDFPWPFSFPKPDQRSIPERKQRQESYGSGVIVRSDGYILTNDHVVGEADIVKVTLKDGRQFEGKVTRDPGSDLAIVKIDARNLPAAKLGDSNKVKPGSWAIAIGSPFGLNNTVTVGVISATGRSEVASDGSQARFYPNLIQTDASINPGNSGGPLVNLDGEVIGINTLIRTSMGVGNIGIGFAIPSNTAKFVMDRLIKHGKVVRGFLGVVPEDLTPEDKERYGVQEGAEVTSVEAGSPADKAGIQVEDVIVEIDGKKVSGELDLRQIVEAIPPGKRVKAVIVRDKKRLTLDVTIGEREQTVALAPGEAKPGLGFNVVDLTPTLAEKYNLSAKLKGVVVTEVDPGSGAERAGLQPGDLITKANGKPVASLSDFKAAVKGIKSGDTLRLIVVSEKRTRIVEVPID